MFLTQLDTTMTFMTTFTHLTVSAGLTYLGRVCIILVGLPRPVGSLFVGVLNAGRSHHPGSWHAATGWDWVWDGLHPPGWGSGYHPWEVYLILKC